MLPIRTAVRVFALAVGLAALRPSPADAAAPQAVTSLQTGVGRLPTRLVPHRAGSASSSFLFVQSATSGTYSSGTLTLRLAPGADHTVYFSGRPRRIAGTVATADFVDLWGAGPDSFASDPPSADLSIVDAGGGTNVVLELRDPALADGVLRYRARPLRGVVPAAFGPASLFIDSGGGLEITLWAEYPVFGAPLASMQDYFARLVAFVEARGISRILFRVQDPGAFPIYEMGAKPSPCSDPKSSQYPHLLDQTTEGQNERNACCIAECGQPGLWCGGYTADGQPTQATHQCSGGCGTALACGAGEESGLFFSELLLNADFVATGCEVYVVPWLDDANPWSFPPGANNVERAAAWIQLANEYVAQQGGGRLISGLVYESEGAGDWSNRAVALPALRQALTANLAAPSPTYANDASSEFKLASASQLNFDDAGTGVYIHQIFPQYYNLTKQPAAGPLLVDATSLAKLLADPSSYTPDFPQTIYTQCTTAASLLGDCGFGSLVTIDATPNPPLVRPADVHYMFSAELAGKAVAGIANPSHTRGCTITGQCPAGDANEACVGTINAFGSPDWSWDSFMAFLEAWGERYDTSQFAIFQFNMLPPEWDPANGGDPAGAGSP